VQVLHFGREIEAVANVPAIELARELLKEQQLITAEHTLKHWPDHLYLPGPVIDRQNRDKWAKVGHRTLTQRAAAEVEKRLAAYEPIETDPQIVQELRQLLQSGVENLAALPEVPE
jgi:trimethylamine:corrinoid methyltransferase-like protein